MDKNLNIFNQKYVKNNHIRATNLLKSHKSSLLEEIGSRLIERIFDFKGRYHNSLEIGSRGNTLAKKLLNTKTIDNYYATALDPLVLPKNSKGIVCSPENIPFASSNFDLIISLLSLHSTNNLKKSLISIKNILNDGGVFIAVIPGGKTLKILKNTLINAELEIKKGIYPRVSPMFDLRDIGNLLNQVGFKNPMTDVDIINKKHLDLIDLIHEIRLCGESNALTDKQTNFTVRKLFTKVENDYQNTTRKVDGQIVTTFEFIFLTGLG